MNKENNKIIEITYFKPKVGVSQEEFGERNIRAGIEYAAKQPGFLGRETGVNADGTWVIVVHWETEADSKNSIQKFSTDPSVADFREMIDPNSFHAEVFVFKAETKK